MTKTQNGKTLSLYESLVKLSLKCSGKNPSDQRRNSSKETKLNEIVDKRNKTRSFKRKDSFPNRLFERIFPWKNLSKWKMSGERSISIVPTLKCFCSSKFFGSSRRYCFVAAQRRKTIQRSIDFTIPIRDSVRLTKRNSLVGRFFFVNNRLNVRSIKGKLCSTVFLLHFPAHTKQWKLSIWWRENKIDLKHLFDVQLIRQIFEIMNKLFVKRKLSFLFQ